MKKIYFTVGPSQLYPTVYKHIQSAFKNDIPSISHRGQQFKDLYKETEDALRKLLYIPATHHIFFTGSSIESMERIIQNTVYRYSTHLISGEFGKTFYKFAGMLQKLPKEISIPNNATFSLTDIKIPKNTEMICITQNDTSTGIALPMDEIYYLKKQNPNALIAIDIVSSAPYGSIDFKQIDIAFFSVQKGFGLPAGLGVLIVNDKAIEKSLWLEKKGIITGTLRRFATLLEKEKIWQTVETPNIVTIYLLEKVTKDFLKKGKEIINNETDKKAKLLYDFFNKHSRYQPFVVNKRYQSPTTIVINVQGETRKLLAQWKQKGLVVGAGYGKNKEEHIRIANFPAHPIKSIKQLLKIF